MLVMVPSLFLLLPFLVHWATGLEVIQAATNPAAFLLSIAAVHCRCLVRCCAQGLVDVVTAGLLLLLFK